MTVTRDEIQEHLGHLFVGWNDDGSPIIRFPMDGNGWFRVDLLQTMGWNPWEATIVIPREVVHEPLGPEGLEKVIGAVLNMTGAVIDEPPRFWFEGVRE